MTTSPRRHRRLRAALGAVWCLTVVPLTALPAAAEDTEAEAVDAPEADGHAATATTMTFDGRGWGHGRGLSQYGAQGYATLDRFGWSSDQILDHFYGGTHAGPASSAVSIPVDPDAVRIRLMAQDAAPTVVAIDEGTLGLNADPGTGVTDPGDLTAVRLTRTDAGTLKVERADTCSGPWTAVGDGDGTTDAETITVGRDSGTDKLQLCRADGVVVWYPGMLRATVVDDVQRTVNITSIEQQLRSVVPRESPASWDAAALEAQAVAARSYALAGDSRHRSSDGATYADTCDTIRCQVYWGHAIREPGGERRPTTDPRTDAAISATSGEVRLTGDDRVARTEFSSTSGGWTAGGTFPAVRDEGDVISPLHTWTRTVAVTGLEEAYGEGGRLVEIEVLRRNGLGADGGRVLDARLHFSNGITRDVSGHTVRSRIRLLSDWFTPKCPDQTPYLNAVYQLFVDRSASGAEIEEWCGTVRSGDRLSLTRQLSVSDEWAGVQIEELYEKILDRPAEGDGRAFWLSQVENGLLIEEIAAEFYGSGEYFWRAGSTHARYVDSLYLDLLGRRADGDGRDFWIKVLDAGARTRAGVAEEFYASIESRRDRVRGLYNRILDRPPETAGRDYWADVLPQLGDVALAAHLGASEEFHATATSASSESSDETDAG